MAQPTPAKWIPRVGDVSHVREMLFPIPILHDVYSLNRRDSTGVKVCNLPWMYSPTIVVFVRMMVTLDQWLGGVLLEMVLKYGWLACYWVLGYSIGGCVTVWMVDWLVGVLCYSMGGLVVYYFVCCVTAWVAGGVLCYIIDRWVDCPLGVLCYSMDGWVVCYSRCVVFQHGWLGGVLL